MPFTRLRQSLIQPNGSITGSLLGTASYAITSSYAMNGGSGGGSTPVVSVASLNNQTILYNFSSSQEATITGLTLTNNNWGINVVEEWNSGSGDIYFNSCSLLLHFSGSNNSTTFIDSSPNNLTVTSNNGAKITSSISKFDGTSGFFDGTNDYLTVPSNANFGFGTGDYTIEFWIYYPPISNTNGKMVIDSRPTGTNGNYWSIGASNTGIMVYAHGSGPLITDTVARTNQWVHYAVSRAGSSLKLFANGTQVASTTDSSTTVASGLFIGTNAFYSSASDTYWLGYIDELRITKGVARYTASFVTQSVQFPDTLPQYETKYIGLIGGLNDTGSDYGVQKLDDTSLKIRKMSVSGTPVSGSPFLSSSVDRVYVNVLNYSNISVGSTLLGQAFTAVGSTSSYALSRSVVNPYEIVVAVDGAVQSFNNAYSVTSSTINFTENIPSGSLVDIRYLTTPNVNSASYALTASYALNGGSGGGSVSTGSIVNQTILYNVTTSQDNTITGLNLTGNKWDISVIEEWDAKSITGGDQYYPSCSVLLHLNGTNGSTTFTDNSPSPKTVTPSGNAQISTVQSKFGEASAYFDGTGDWLNIPSSSVFAMGVGDWTIECWAYPTISPSTNWTPIFTMGATGGGKEIRLGQNIGGNGFGYLIPNNTNTVDIVNGYGTLTLNQWHHLALVRYGSTVTLYRNGVFVGSTTSVSFNHTSTTEIRLGGSQSGYGDGSFGGYIDELRITNGVARYTANFTPQTSEFLNFQFLTQLQTKYVGLVGGINDSNVDYGVEKLSDGSLKIRKMSATGQPLSGSGALSASVDRVYVNVLNYENAVITGSISNAVTASFAQTTPSGKSIALSFILG